MNYQKMRHAVNIQQKSEVQDSVTGLDTETWTTIHQKVWCSIEPLSARDYIQSKANQSEVSVRVVMRYRSGLDGTMRFVGACGCHSGKIYNPVAPIEDPNSGIEWITFPCSQGVNQG